MLMETSIDMIADSSPIESPPSPDFLERPPSAGSAGSAGCLNCIETILPWAIGVTAVGTAGYLSWQLINKYNEIPPSI